MNSSALKGLYLIFSSLCALACVSVSARAASEPLPSPLYDQSRLAAIDGLTQIALQAEPALKPSNREAAGTAELAAACIYELICIDGNSDTLEQYALVLGVHRKRSECGGGYWDCETAFISGAGSVRLFWRYIGCEISDLPEVPPFPFILTPCQELPTTEGFLTCLAATCMFAMTCGPQPSCPGYYVPTMTCGGPTCSPGVTCFGGTCNLGPTCIPFEVTCRNYGTCSGFATCQGMATCNQTCTGLATCAGSATCGSGQTCDPAPTCQGVATCDAQVGCTLCSCPKQGDLNGNGTYDIADLLGIIMRVYYDDRPARQDPNCPHSDRADLSCDGRHDILDIVLWVDCVWRKIPNAICDPCTQSGSR